MKILIIGDSPAFEIPKLSKYDFIIGLDGIANKIAKLHLKFDLIIGDLDSIKPKIIKNLNELKIPLIKVEDQNLTDADKGIMHALSLHAAEIDLVNVLHGRLDHTLYNLGLLKKYFSKNLRIKIINNFEIIEYLRDQSVKLIGKAGDEVALMAYPKAYATSQGLEYKLKNFKLELGISESSSNKMCRPVSIIKIKKEALLIYKNCINCNYI